MHYALRINHHAGDHGRLIHLGVRPAVARMRAECGAVPAALRAHWRGGPHLLIGLETDDGRRAARAWAILEADIQDWLAAEPLAPALDPVAYEALSRSLALQEQLPHAAMPLRPDNRVERGDYEVPAPLDNPDLAPLRDAFQADVLDDIFSLVAERLDDPVPALLGWVRRIVCLEHLRWRDGLRLWPLSPQGQALVITRASAKAAADFPKLAAGMEAQLVEIIEREGLLGSRPRLSAESRRWLAVMQHHYDRLLAFADEADPAFFEAIYRDTLNSGPSPTSEAMGVTPERAAYVLANPTHFAFRMLINFIYGMLPCVGFSASRRFFACFLVTHTLESRYPDVLRRAASDGLKL